MKRFFALAITAILSLNLLATSASAGWFDESSDVAVMEQLDKMIAQSNKVVGMPAITNFFEKRMVRQLYEYRDDPTYRTHTYITTLDGKFIKVCDSIGYGINASIQFSNPEKPADISQTPAHDYAGVTLGQLPQAEPNGLFMPEGLAATYVLCLDPATKDSEAPKLAPIYLEQEVAVSPFPLN